MGKRLPPAMRLGGVLVVLIAATAVVSLLWLPQDPDAANFMVRLTAPTGAHLLGTDHFGRDLLSRMMAGARNALWVGMVAVGIGLAMGVTLGTLAAFSGGMVDRVVTPLLEALYAFPALLLALLLATAWRPGATSSMVAVGLSVVPIFARLARAGVLTAKAQPYVEAARAVGVSGRRLVWRHVLPNILGPIVIQATLAMAAAVLIEAALSYLGLGTQPPTASWGRMLREAQSFMFLSPYPALWPGLGIAATVLGFNLLGDGLRDWMDPRRRSQRQVW
ncbi:MAG: ABC transporter permease [Armatimonadota bacterium]|nr:ABC transporter permease [Armatimonadota bacterium]